MAKRTQRTRTERTGTSVWEVVKFLAYIAMVIAAVAAMLAFVFGLLAKIHVQIGWAGKVTNTCSTVAQVALIISVIIPAYHYMRPKGAVVRAFFWVAVIFLVLGLVGLNLAVY